MSTVLYPVFVYMFLYMLMLDYWSSAREFFSRFSKDFATAHRGELIALQELRRASLFDEPVFKKYMQEKYVLNISPYSYKLLLHFLQLRMLVTLLHIFNMHIKFQITSDRWTLEQHSPSASPLPYTKEQLLEINNRELLWKRLPIMPELMEEQKGEDDFMEQSDTKIPLPSLKL
eukprot:TRINITY_DN9721_c0_g2_i1.p2 TRINITY_DN9721_c0_g2~~TRINITY_DN9721_c0_g2_i1.p2  ORF type:complete len:174 (-),score=39.60 TRINITY_DN9721_c0_g2_i1:1272-1793(-)